MAIEVIDKIVQKNGGKFPLMDAKNVVCEDDKTVEEKLKEGGVSSWNDLTDKPFGEETTVLYEWDGNTEGLENIRNLYYKVTDKTMTAEELVGSIATINDLNNTLLNEVAIVESALTVNDTYISVMDNAVLIVFEDTPFVEDDVLTKGIWHVNPSDIQMYVSECKKSTIKTLESKYLPKDTIAEWIDEYINEALGGEY